MSNYLRREMRRGGYAVARPPNSLESPAPPRAAPPPAPPKESPPDPVVAPSPVPGAVVPRAVTDLTPMQMLQIAVQRGVDTEQLSRLMDLNDRWLATQARNAFT